MLKLLLVGLAAAAPFVTTWRTTTANEAIILPLIKTQSSVNVSWGDAALDTVPESSSVSLTHTYPLAGLYNVSMEGQILWSVSRNITRNNKLIDIVSWGDGFLVDQNSKYLFFAYYNLSVSAPPNTQPVFLPNATLEGMFYQSSFNSSLDWDLANVTDVSSMFFDTPLNKPITFRNTRGVTSTYELFSQTSQFNQAFHFDASGLLDASSMFEGAEAFNQLLNLTNSTQLTSTAEMFSGAVSFNHPLIIRTDSVTNMAGMFANAASFNQPLSFNTDSVTDMEEMFDGAIKFNQAVNFNVSQVNTMRRMFSGATDFNQPINFQASASLTRIDSMFANAVSFNQPVVMNTSSVDRMSSMFSGATSFASTVNFTSTAQVIAMDDMFVDADGFTQDLSSWAVPNVGECTSFCAWCGLPSFTQCVPCDPIYTNQNVSVCNNGTRAPTRAPSAASAAPSVSVAPSPAGSSVSAAALLLPSLAWMLVVLLPLAGLDL